MKTEQEDPILEVRANRQKILEEFGDDHKAYFAYIRKRQAESGHKVVDLSGKSKPQKVAEVSPPYST